MSDEEIFAEAIRLSGSQLASFLDSACNGDSQRRERIERLIRAHESPDSYLENAVPENGMPDTIGLLAASKHPVIGNYKLLHKLGEGGFGVVYMAEQLKPVRRKVAIKIVKADRLSDPSATVARFEAERQALAMMDHPNIATIFDGGTLPAGSSILDQTLGSVERPYFVMELVNGVPITDYCDKNNLPTRERLQLFATVCQAVHHAHQKGVIHRDLKPSNILVTLHDGHPVVKIIDFGVAKAINQQLTEKTLYTVLGDMIGTPLYMSPEQAERSGLDIDTRSDVYSLGVLLYELLTGSTPITSDELKQAGLLQIQRRIVDSEPPKPSTRLSTSGEKLTIIAKHRSISPERLHRELQGDLDWIVMKALEKDRTRRYESASSFGDDVRRFLNNDFVEARPPSTWYRVSKFCKRHTALVASTLVVIGVLSIALVTVWWQKTQVDNALIREQQTAEKARQATESERLAKEDANRERDKSRAQEEQLREANDKQQRTLAELRDELIERSLVHAYNGEKEKAQEAISQAVNAGASVAWRYKILAQIELYTTNPRNALQHLDKAIELEPKDVTAHAMRAVALAFDGAPPEFQDELKRLENDLKPVTAFDKLFASQAYAMLVNSHETARTTRLVNEAFDERKSPLAAAIQAQIIGHEALDKGDPERAQVALAKVTAARELIPNNPYISMIYVSVHHTAYNLQVPGIDLSKFEKVLRENEDMGSYALGHIVVGMCYEDLGQHVKAEDAHRKGASNSHWWFYQIRSLTASGNLVKAREVLQNSSRSSEDPFLANKRICGLYLDLIDKRRTGKLDLESAGIPENQISRLLSNFIELLLLNGQYAEAVEIAKVYQASELYPAIAIELLRNEKSIVDLWNAFSTSRIRLATELYTLGMIRWSRGDLSGAREAFQSSRRTKCFFGYGYYASEEMLMLIERGLTPDPK